jgi:hypothetical protein
MNVLSTSLPATKHLEGERKAMKKKFAGSDPQD